MIEKTDVIYNLDYIVCIPNYDLAFKEAFEYSFKNVYFLNDNWNDVENFISFIKRSNIKNIIFVDYLMEYMNVINAIDSEIGIKFIFTRELANLSNDETELIFNSIIDLYEKNIIKCIGFLDENLYLALKNTGMNVALIKLDIAVSKKKTISKNKSNIGLLNASVDPNHSFYNELSAIKLNKNNYIPNIPYVNQQIIDFTNVFKIDFKPINNFEELFICTYINLYVNFNNSNILTILKSMDAGVPCILGNGTIFNSFPSLKEMLMVKSDDDINEISDKIDSVAKNRDRIMDEYKTFRKEYSKNSLISIQNFVDSKIQLERKTQNNNLLLSVIVPVYNTERYIDECLNSIYAAQIDNMEIIIINDGSTDNSDEIIQAHLKKHPNLIKYIKQENHGLGNVRNVGLQNAKGKYIASIDSDDTINKNIFKEALPFFKKDIDILIYDWLSVYNDGQKFETAAIDYIFSNINQYKGLLYTTIMPSTCNKIIKKSLIDNLELNYAEGRKYEDLSLNPILLLKANSIKYINKPYYEYKITDNSIMRTGAGHDMIYTIEMLDERIKKLFDNQLSVDINEFKYYTYFWRIEEYVFNQLYDLPQVERDTFINLIYEYLSDILKALYTNKYYLERIKTFDKSTQEYLNNRNDALFDKNLNDFLEKVISENSYKKLTPPLIFYNK